MKICIHQMESIFLSVVLLAHGLVEATCPDNPNEKVQECTASILPQLQQPALEDGVSTINTQVEAAKDTCRDSRLRDAADCIQDILDRCRGTTDAEQMLHRLIDKDKTMATVDYFCKHIALYERHQKCISSHHDEMSVCTEAAHRSFKSKLDAGAKMDVLIMGSCSFFFIARGCLTNTTQQFCGGEAANFAHTLLTGYMPPYCETQLPEDTTRGRWGSGDTYNTGDDGNGAATSHVQPFSVLTVLTMFLTVFLTFG